MNVNLDSPWKIAAVIAVLAALRIVWALWKAAPSRRFMVELLDSGLIAFVLVFVLIRPFVVQAFFIPSGSMIPTLQPGDRILVNKFIYRLNEPKRGDIIVFNAPDWALFGNGHKDYVKRLIGLPGDEIVIKRGEGVFVNGRHVEDSATIPLPEYNWPLDDTGVLSDQPYVVPEDCYFVLGDNRNQSNDSHQWSDQLSGEAMPFLPKANVLGKAMVLFWPIPRIGMASDHTQLKLADTTKVASAAASDQPVQ
jgi:signal peptidase I